VIIDTSAVLAIVLNEPDMRRFAEAIVDAPSARMSVANWLEAAMVVDRRGGPIPASRFSDFIGNTDIELVPVSLPQATLARQAWNTFGRGAHPAKLNFGDCFAYALAKETREPLLFKGTDFAQTDIEPALKD
jgi:ribonuclease VapC